MKIGNHKSAGDGVDKVDVEFTFTPRNARASSGADAPAPESASSHDVASGNIPRVTRLMALAIKFEGMLARGEVRDYADLARLGYVTRARVTQIMNLTNLAPDIQEEILFLPRTVRGRDPIREQNLRPITAIPHWNRQREEWEAMKIERLSRR